MVIAYLVIREVIHLDTTLAPAEIVQALKETILPRMVGRNATGDVEEHDPSPPKGIALIYRLVAQVDVVSKLHALGLRIGWELESSPENVANSPLLG